MTLDIKNHPYLRFVTKCWQTNPPKYNILMDEMDGFKHLRIRRLDKQPGHNFLDLQEIKNDLWGRDVIAVEVYPRQKDLRNNSNTYHLWTWEGIVVPNLVKLYSYMKEIK